MRCSTDGRKDLTTQPQFENLINLEEQYQVATYKKFPFVIERGTSGSGKWVPELCDHRVLEHPVSGGDVLRDFGVIYLRVCRQQAVHHRDAKDAAVLGQRLDLVVGEVAAVVEQRPAVAVGEQHRVLGEIEHRHHVLVVEEHRDVGFVDQHVDKGLIARQLIAEDLERDARSEADRPRQGITEVAVHFAGGGGDPAVPNGRPAAGFP